MRRLCPTHWERTSPPPASSPVSASKGSRAIIVSRAIAIVLLTLISQSLSLSVFAADDLNLDGLFYQTLSLEKIIDADKDTRGGVDQPTIDGTTPVTLSKEIQIPDAVVEWAYRINETYVNGELIFDPEADTQGSFTLAFQNTKRARTKGKRVLVNAKLHPTFTLDLDQNQPKVLKVDNNVRIDIGIALPRDWVISLRGEYDVAIDPNLNYDLEEFSSQLLFSKYWDWLK